LRGQLSQGKEFLKQSAQEAGLDDRHMKLLSAITRPALFPDFTWHSSGNGYWDEADDERSNELVVIKRAASTVYLMNKQRELNDRIQRSCHHIRPAQTVDVVRYNTQQQITAPDVAVMQSMGINGKLASDEQYFPVLLNKKKGRAGRKKAKLNADGTEELEQKESGGEMDRNQKGEEEEDDDDIELELEQGEEEDGEDYTTNYYASDDESDGGEDGEPTF
jgi:hypothetical protein